MSTLVQPPLNHQRADFGVRRARARYPNGAGSVTTPPGGEQRRSHPPQPAGQDPRLRAAPGRPAQPSALVRPYAMTGGRTRPSHHLAIEALVSTTTPLSQPVAQSPEVYRIRLLCQEVKSVAEISAHLALPLGVTRILVADLAEAGLVAIQQPGGDDAHGGRPHVTLLERVLSGLRGL
ncbi:DUF742 domain-containing protein [Streptomyces sp. NBC_00358]|uniref:DUF742 domain-containing protein n=1 Tax=Streptomyces sp. NBC_00358 TaxID=2975725 RepID=UPI003FA6EFC3